ncbi:GDYXXLXY domain-containing protein [Aquimarina sp. Aq78]|uniref:GDYXXLXY domain-containing protein n=1 Tax=Aquimarina sp. Aq78 TaxID=1191889 RepID=UPI000D0F7D0A|nr:GDYXXLXY domain-containing protein [Aquimarina sp. Aq78]
MKPIYFIVFIVLAVVQIGTPLKMIFDNEDILISGTAYKFKTRPIDPTDPFRGKYITLQFEMNSFKTSDTTYVYGDEVRVYIENDQEGFAKVVRVSREPLDIDGDYVMAKVTNTYSDEILFELPFDRFYMEETKAYDAEKAYREVNRNAQEEDVYAVVYVKDGASVLDDVIIAGLPIQEYVE